MERIKTERFPWSKFLQQSVKPWNNSDSKNSSSTDHSREDAAIVKSFRTETSSGNDVGRCKEFVVQ